MGRVMRGVAVAVLIGLLAGCGVGYKTILPPSDLPSLNSTPFYRHCTDVSQAHCHLFFIGAEAIEVETWTEPALPFGTMRYANWFGGHRKGWLLFRSKVWFPRGVPTRKGEFCGWQEYEGIKVEGTIHRELNGLYHIHGYPLEYKPSEQHGMREKCDLDIVPDVDNMAGY